MLFLFFISFFLDLIDPLNDAHFKKKKKKLNHQKQFDRERIPERVVHARGASAKGFFETTHDVSHLTCADLFRSPGTQTPVIARFSTVIHERGSPETIRDPRGFAVKFYTREGNWDLVGNNMPVFFVRDGMKFPDMVHALKPNPVNHIQVSSCFFGLFFNLFFSFQALFAALSMLSMRERSSCRREKAISQKDSIEKNPKNLMKKSHQKTRQTFQKT